MHRLVIVAGLVASFSVPCLAANEFYVAQDPTTKNCKIVTQKPDGTSLVMIGTSSYSKRGDAKAAKHAASECKQEGEH
jgi:hypothetical protein